MPCESGPALCGHLSRSAKISSVPVRNTAMSPMDVATTREPSRGMSTTEPTSIQTMVSSPPSAISVHRRQSAEFPRRFATLSALRPRIGLEELLGITEPLGQGLAFRRVVQEPGLHVVEPDAFDPRRRALKIMRFLAIELEESAAVFQHFVIG